MPWSWCTCISGSGRASASPPPALSQRGRGAASYHAGCRYTVATDFRTGVPPMLTIDADAHVLETEHTWDYLEPDECKYRPLLVSPRDDERAERWLIDGKLRGL